MKTPDDYTLFDALKASLAQRQPEPPRLAGRCGACKHWDREFPQRGKRRCAMLEDSVEVFVDAYEKAGNFTSADFGCVLFEEK